MQLSKEPSGANGSLHNDHNKNLNHSTGITLFVCWFVLENVAKMVLHLVLLKPVSFSGVWRHLH